MPMTIAWENDSCLPKPQSGDFRVGPHGGEQALPRGGALISVDGSDNQTWSAECIGQIFRTGAQGAGHSKGSGDCWKLDTAGGTNQFGQSV